MKGQMDWVTWSARTRLLGGHLVSPVLCSGSFTLFWCLNVTLEAIRAMFAFVKEPRAERGNT